MCIRDRTGIDLIYHQIVTVAGSAAVLRHGNGFCPGFIVLRDTPVMVLVLDGVCTVSYTHLDVYKRQIFKYRMDKR